MWRFYAQSGVCVQMLQVLGAEMSEIVEGENQQENRRAQGPTVSRFFHLVLRLDQVARSGTVV